jgi:ribonuclease PH
VQVVIYGPREPKSRSNSHPDKAVISVEVGVVPWAQSGGAKKSRGDRYVHQKLIGGWTEADYQSTAGSRS